MTGRGWLKRWLKFNTVGALGIVVQLVVLAVLRGLLRTPYLAATAVAVETAVLHNFVWHELWTWKDRRGTGRGVLVRLARFNLSNGLVSMVVNLALMRLLVGRFHVHYLVANGVCIAAGSLANFFLSELFVFDAAPRETKPGRRPYLRGFSRRDSSRRNSGFSG